MEHEQAPRGPRGAERVSSNAEKEQVVGQERERSLNVCVAVCVWVCSFCYRPNRRKLLEDTRRQRAERLKKQREKQAAIKIQVGSTGCCFSFDFFFLLCKHMYIFVYVFFCGFWIFFFFSYLHWHMHLSFIHT